MAQIYFVSGIDTGIGKTYTTGYLAKVWNAEGQRTITQKLIQTGFICSKAKTAKSPIRT